MVNCITTLKLKMKAVALLLLPILATCTASPATTRDVSTLLKNHQKQTNAKTILEACAAFPATKKKFITFLSNKISSKCQLFVASVDQMFIPFVAFPSQYEVIILEKIIPTAISLYHLHPIWATTVTGLCFV